MVFKDAVKERARIRRAQAGALRELRRLLKAEFLPRVISSTAGHSSNEKAEAIMDLIDNATKPAKGKR